jgi:anti-sigma factor (TIGR02949 family)
MKLPDRLSCEETFLRLDDYLDRELDAGERQLVEGHLADCEVCTAEYRFEATVLEGLRNRLRRVRLPDGVRERLLARLRAAIPPV